MATSILTDISCFHRHRIAPGHVDAQSTSLLLSHAPPVNDREKGRIEERGKDRLEGDGWREEGGGREGEGGGREGERGENEKGQESRGGWEGMDGKGEEGK